MKTQFILILLLLSTIACGQVQSDSVKTKGMFIYSIFELPKINTSDINETLRANGLSNFRLSPASIGLQFEFITNRMIFVIQWSASEKSFPNDTSTQTGSYSAAGMNLGYNLVKDKVFNVIPNVGIKITDVQYEWQTLSTNPNGKIFFSQRNEYLEFNSTQYSLDLGCKLTIHKKTSACIAFGYQIPLHSTIYSNQNDLELSQIPSINASYYFNVGLGLGRFYK